MSKFLVLWSLDVAHLGSAGVKAVLAMPTYAESLFADKKLEHRYHLVGKHGGAWIYNVNSNEELDRLLAMSPVYNMAHYEVLPLAEMSEAGPLARSSD